jgi:hypothetical protein
VQRKHPRQDRSPLSYFALEWAAAVVGPQQERSEGGKLVRLALWEPKAFSKSEEKALRAVKSCAAFLLGSEVKLYIPTHIERNLIMEFGDQPFARRPEPVLSTPLSELIITQNLRKSHFLCIPAHGWAATCVKLRGAPGQKRGLREIAKQHPIGQVDGWFRSLLKN